MEFVKKLVKADQDGVIHLNLNLLPDVPYELVLVYQRSQIDARPPIVETPEERTKALMELAGSWQGEFHGFEERESP